MGGSCQCQTAFQTNFLDLLSKETTLFMGSIQLGGIFSIAADCVMQVKTSFYTLPPRLINRNFILPSGSSPNL